MNNVYIYEMVVIKPKIEFVQFIYSILYIESLSLMYKIFEKHFKSFFLLLKKAKNRCPSDAHSNKNSSAK